MSIDSDSLARDVRAFRDWLKGGNSFLDLKVTSWPTKGLPRGLYRGEQHVDDAQLLQWVTNWLLHEKRDTSAETVMQIARAVVDQVWNE